MIIKNVSTADKNQIRPGARQLQDQGRSAKGMGRVGHHGGRAQGSGGAGGV